MAASNNTGTLGPWWRTLTPACLLLAALLSGCAQSPQQPASGADSAGDPQSLSEAQQRLHQSALRAAQQQNYASAIESLERLQRSRPEHPEVWSNLATAYFGEGETDKAREALEKAEFLGAEPAALENLKGSMALEEGKLEQAKKHFHQAVEHNPETADAHYNLGLIYDTYFQDIARAIEHYQRYLTLTPEEDSQTAQWVEQLERSL